MIPSTTTFSVTVINGAIVIEENGMGILTINTKHARQIFLGLWLVLFSLKAKMPKQVYKELEFEMKQEAECCDLCGRPISSEGLCARQGCANSH